LTLASCTTNVAPPQPELDVYAAFIEESGRRAVIAFGGRYAEERCEGAARAFSLGASQAPESPCPMSVRPFA
jgi:hypothetical protein